MPEDTNKADVGGWLLLIHQIPPKPDYFRVKVGRRLQRLGAVALKNSVYVLPRSDTSTEDFHWVAREIAADGGDATVCAAQFIEGVSDGHVEALFNGARDADYAQVAEEARALSESLPAVRQTLDQKRAEVEGRIARLKRRLSEIAAIDFFGAPSRGAAEGLLADVEARLQADPSSASTAKAKVRAEQYRSRTWVTRKGIHVDRMASAWLIRRFIDPKARFKFVPGKGYEPETGELRFDMFEAEFTHEGDQCTFEVLVARFALAEPGLRAIAEIVHDIDLKDAKFERPDAIGFERLVAGIAMAHKDDEARLERASAVLDDLYAYFQRKPGKKSQP